MIPEFYPRKKPKAILFDWDNTLVNTWRVAFDSINLAREAIGFSPLTIEEFWNKPHHSTRDAATDLFGKHAKEGERLFYENVEKLHLKDISILEGAEELLHELSSLGIYLGIVSNKVGHFLRKEVDHLGWNPHFKKIVGSKDTEKDKPSHIPVLAALETSSIVPSHDVWFVGDSIVDVYCARASGCIPVVVGSGEAAKEQDIILANDCHGLANIIKNI